MKNLRIAFYSHDALGLGHLRRNLLLADTLSQDPVNAHVLLLAGAPELNKFPIPAGVDTVTLPALAKTNQGSYAPRNQNMTLQDLLILRSRILRSTLDAFAPDVLVVDKHPRGILGELDSTIPRLAEQTGTRMVLGLRDILDAPDTVNMEWDRDRCREVIEEQFDAVWVYGDPAVYDPRLEYNFPSKISSKLQFTGYLNPGLRLRQDEWGTVEGLDDLAAGPLSLCLLGGGQDGGILAETFAKSLPEHMNGLIITGPYMPSTEQHGLLDLAKSHHRLRVQSFVPNPGAYLNLAQSVVAMGGYNTTCEVLASGKPLLVVPRVRPRTEQLLRAQRLEQLGLLDYIHPDALTPESLHEWLESPGLVQSSPSRIIDFAGVDRIPQLIDHLLAGARIPNHASRRIG